MSNYSRGAEFERRVGTVFGEAGYAVVRSAGSHSPTDLVCMKGGETVCVQCKTGGRFPRGERERFAEWCETAGAVGVLASRDGRTLVLTRVDDGSKYEIQGAGSI